METRLNLLCDAGVIDKDICKGMMQVVNVLETECHLPARSEQGTMAMTHMASALMRSRRGEEIEPLDDELLAELAQSSHWQAVVQLHQVLLKEFALEVNPCEEGYLLANLYGWLLTKRFEAPDKSTSYNLNIQKNEYLIQGTETRQQDVCRSIETPESGADFRRTKFVAAGQDRPGQLGDRRGSSSGKRQAAD